MLANPDLCIGFSHFGVVSRPSTASIRHLCVPFFLFIFPSFRSLFFDRRTPRYCLRRNEFNVPTDTRVPRYLFDEEVAYVRAAHTLVQILLSSSRFQLLLRASFVSVLRRNSSLFCLLSCFDCLILFLRSPLSSVPSLFHRQCFSGVLFFPKIYVAIVRNLPLSRCVSSLSSPLSNPCAKPHSIPAD